MTSGYIHMYNNYHMAVNFVESPKRLSKLILNFMTETIQGAWHCISNDIMNTHVHNLLYYEAMPTETWTNSMR